MNGKGNNNLYVEKSVEKAIEFQLVPSPCANTRGLLMFD